MKNKEEIRRNTLKKRLSLSSEDIREKSQQILQNLIQTVEYKNSQNIMFYAATKSEVQTKEIIKMSTEMGKNVFIPIILPEYPDLIPSKIYDFDIELEIGNKGILQPKKEYQRLGLPENIDLIIVPGIAFDSDGHRIGRGFGYYDIFLKKVSSSARIIALAFEIQIVKKIMTDKNDVPVHKIITEKRTINSIQYRVSSI